MPAASSRSGRKQAGRTACGWSPGAASAALGNGVVGDPRQQGVERRSSPARSRGGSGRRRTAAAGTGRRRGGRSPARGSPPPPPSPAGRSTRWSSPLWVNSIDLIRSGSTAMPSSWRRSSATRRGPGRRLGRPLGDEPAELDVVGDLDPGDRLPVDAVGVEHRCFSGVCTGRGVALAAFGGGRLGRMQAGALREAVVALEEADEIGHRRRRGAHRRPGAGRAASAGPSSARPRRAAPRRGSRPSAPSRARRGSRPPVSASASSIRKSVSGGSPASPSISPAPRPVSESHSATAARQTVSSCREAPLEQARLHQGGPGDQRPHRAQASARTGNQVAEDETVGVSPGVRAAGGEGARHVRPDRPGALRRRGSDFEEAREVDEPRLGQRHVVGAPGAGVAEERAEPDDLLAVVEGVDLADEAVSEAPDPGHELPRRPERRRTAAPALPRCSAPGSAASARSRARRWRTTSR